MNKKLPRKNLSALRQKNLAVFFLLLLFIVLVFGLAIVRMGDY